MALFLDKSCINTAETHKLTKFSEDNQTIINPKYYHIYYFPTDKLHSFISNTNTQVFMTRIPRPFNGTRTVLSINGIGKTRYPHAQG